MRVVVLILLTLFTLAQAALPHESCTRNFRKIGCYNSDSKPLPVLLITDRDESSDLYQGHKIDWINWDKYIHSLACRCASKAKKEGYKIFGLQNYGECWGGHEDDKVYDKEPKKCYPNPCDVNKPLECVGSSGANYVYKMVEDDPCKSSPCKNGGTCKKGPHGFLCICPANFDGSTCENDVNECLKKPCKNGATCSNSHGSFACKCPTGYNGKLCELDVNECLTSPCKNGATCSNTDGSFVCKCPTGYKGKLCEIDVNECHKNPCKNGGKCLNTPGSFVCKCATGFTGKLCEQDVNECLTSPCKNGAACVNTHGSFVCKCPSGYKGKYCEKSCATPVVDLAIVVDSSGSIGNNKYMEIKRFLLSLVSRLGISYPKTHVALMYYSDKAHIRGKFNSAHKFYYDPIQVKLGILGMPYMGADTTRTDLALITANKGIFEAKKGDRPSVPNVLMVISDGEHAPGTVNPLKDAVKTLTDRGVRMLALAVHNAADEAGLSIIAQGKKKNVFLAKDGIEKMNLNDVIHSINNSC